MGSSPDEQAVRDLYSSLLDRWNARDAEGMASLLSADANMVGFDGSQMIGRAEVATTLDAIFANHPTAAYVSIVRDVRFPSADVAILRAVVGMVPPGTSDINAAVNAVQSCSRCEVMASGASSYSRTLQRHIMGGRRRVRL